MARLTDNVKFLHKVVLIHEGEVLILKRSEKADSRPGKWDLPGGNAEWPGKEIKIPTADIHAFDVAREVLEETGVEISSDLFSNALNEKSNHLVHFFSFFEPEQQVYSIMCGWKLQFSGSDKERDLTDFNRDSITISPEHTEQLWIKPSELDNYDFGGVPGDFIKTIIKRAV